MSIADKLQTIAENELRVYEAGKKSEYDRFWDKYFNSPDGTNKVVDGVAVVNGETLFAGKGWNDNTYKPPYPIQVTYGYNMFYSSGIRDTVIDIDFSKATYMASALSQGLFKHIKTVDLSSAKDSTSAIFMYSRKLETIERIVFSEVNPLYDRIFLQCTSLKNITADGVIAKAISFSDSPLLTKASITSVMNTLSTNTSGLAVTFSLTAVNKAFETSEGANDGSTSTEWRTLANSKSNWTINLS